MASSAPDMSILRRNNGSTKMGTPIFHEFKKQASFFFREKIKSARLALTDVTPAQLLTEEATDGNPWAPDSRILTSISRAAFELDDYCRIVDILHNRFSSFDKKNWRVSYNSMIVLEHLLTHGPESVPKEFQNNTEAFNDMGRFQYIDEKGFNWGLAVRKKSDKIVKLLEMGPLLKQERDHARKVSRGIQGFGSFCERSSQPKAMMDSSPDLYGRCNSIPHFETEENQNKNRVDQDHLNEECGKSKKTEGLKMKSWCSFGESQAVVKCEQPEEGSKENNPPPVVEEEEEHKWECAEETKSLLSGQEEEERFAEEEQHPFYEPEKQTSVSLIPTRDGLVLGY